MPEPASRSRPTEDSTGSAADFTDADLTCAELRRAKLTRAVFDGADLSGANVSGADLSGASLRRTVMVSVNLANANLAGADLSTALAAEPAKVTVGDLPLSEALKAHEGWCESGGQDGEGQHADGRVQPGERQAIFEARAMKAEVAPERQHERIGIVRPQAAEEGHGEGRHGRQKQDEAIFGGRNTA